MGLWWGGDLKVEEVELLWGRVFDGCVGDVEVKVCSLGGVLGGVW